MSVLLHPVVWSHKVRCRNADAHDDTSCIAACKGADFGDSDAQLLRFSKKILKKFRKILENVLKNFRKSLQNRLQNHFQEEKNIKFP